MAKTSSGFTSARGRLRTIARRIPAISQERRNQRTQHVRTVNAAVGEKAGVLSFSEGRMSVNCRVSESGALKVPCVTLDSELSNIPGIDLLKIDTEGYETHVLQGAFETLKKTRRIALELHHPGEALEIESTLLPLGFCLLQGRLGHEVARGWECFFCRSIRRPHQEDHIEGL